MIDKRGKYFYPVCDGCGEELQECDSWDEAVDAMRAEGWAYDRTFEVNLCPTCREDSE